MGTLFAQAISLTAEFNPWLILAIFLITLVAEFGFSIPYLLETIWLLTGFSASGGTLSPVNILLFCFIGLAGREIGALLLYRVIRIGGMPFTRLFMKLEQSADRGSDSRFKKYFVHPALKLLKKMLILPHEQVNGKLIKIRISPLSVALARFVGMKLPVTISLGITRQLFILLLGGALFSLTWDGLYIVIGALGGKSVSPGMMVVFSVGGFAILQAIIYSVRRLHGKRAASRQTVTKVLN